LKAIILDDEPNACELLHGMIQQFCPEITQCTFTSNHKEAIEWMKESEPDVLFLDINMPEVSGFDFLQKIASFSGKVVFTTAYDQYALRAFEVGAFDYLLKPIQIERLEETVRRIDKTRQDSKNEIQSEILELFETLKSRENQLTSIAVNHRSSMKFIETKNILFLKGSGNYSEIVCSDYTYMSTKTLKDFEGVLDNKSFLRVHKSYLVNINFVERSQLIDGYWHLEINGLQIPVSRRKRYLIDQFIV
jgi:two-component system LytT family response regulator